MNPAALGALLKGDIDNFVVATTPGGIEAQEKRGQLAVAGTPGKLPITGTTRPEERATWKSLGFVFGEPIDNLWAAVTFPAGWTVVPTDHSMWSDIVDGNGQKRASMFFKAAFYDTSCHVRLNCRYSVATDYETKDRERWCLFDQGRVAKEILSTPLSADKCANYDANSQKARAWLAKTYPDAGNPLAYWE